MWSRMFIMSVGRVTVATGVFTTIAFSLISLWLFVIEPMLPGLFDAVVAGYGYAAERAGWLFDWFSRQF